jgi:hypothetical protein
MVMGAKEGKALCHGNCAPVFESDIFMTDAKRAQLR